MLAYLRLQLLHKLRGYDPRSFRRENQSAAKAILSFAGLCLLALYVYGVVVWLETMLFRQFQAMGQESAVVGMALLLSTFVTLLYGFFSLVGQLFFGRDTAFVSALPMTSRQVLAVKTLMVALSEAGVTLLLCGPLAIQLGASMSAGVGFYLKAVLLCLFTPLLPIAVSLCLAFALIRLSALWKRREGMTTVLSFALMIGVMMLSMASQQLDEAKLQGLLLSLVVGKGSLTNVILGHYPPLQWANDALLLNGAGALWRLLLFMAVSAAGLGLFVWALGGGYLRLASRQEESLRRVNTGRGKSLGKERKTSPFLALLKQELREVLTVPAYATNCLTGVVMFPMMLVIVVVSMQSRSDITNFALEMAQWIPREAFLAGACGLFCLVNTMGMAVGTAVSREGKRHDMRKTYPVSGATHLLAKVTMGMIFNLATGIVTAVTLWVVLPAFAAETLLGLLFGQVFSFAWCVAALMMDTYHPRLDWKTETEAVKQNFNSFLSMLLGVGMTAVLGAAVWLCVKLGGTLQAGLGVALILTILGGIAGGFWLKGRGARAYAR